MEGSPLVSIIEVINQDQGVANEPIKSMQHPLEAGTQVKAYIPVGKGSRGGLIHDWVTGTIISYSIVGAQRWIWYEVETNERGLKRIGAHDVTAAWSPKVD